ncbi:MAG: hypothetical protein EGR26_00340 [Clostridiales bacterium]|nr:hypothetical protein [Clostridiales bacterium]
MRNNGKKLVRLLAAALLALAMTLSLTACQVEIPGVGTININDGNAPTGGNVPDRGDTDGDGMDGGEPGAYDDSLDLLRQELDERQQDERFAVAYIGDIDGDLSDLAIPLRDWINDTAPGLCAQYTFVRNIPQERVVGDRGSLFCVVPRDPNATVVVNRVRWNEAKGGYETLEVLYRSESGDPILLFISNDLGTVPTDTTELLLTDSHPDTLSWYPIPGIVALPYDYENDRKLAYDFTFYSQEGNDGFGSDIGWTCPTGSQLTQEIWAWQGNTDKPALATLELHANSSQEGDWGTATFTWWYESDFVTPEEVYTGDWGLTGNGEYSGILMLDLTRTGGKRYTPGETERIIHDGFIVQVPMAFEDYTYLSIDKGQHGSYLPVQIEPDTVLYFYPQWG